MLSSVVNPLPVVLDLHSEECTIIDTSKCGDISGSKCTDPATFSPFFILIIFSVGGQAQWVPGDIGGVLFIGWENKPQKLGFLYSTCRRCDL